jgi:hypothetical protein
MVVSGIASLLVDCTDQAKTRGPPGNPPAAETQLRVFHMARRTDDRGRFVDLSERTWSSRLAARADIALAAHRRRLAYGFFRSTDRVHP